MMKMKKFGVRLQASIFMSVLSALAIFIPIQASAQTTCATGVICNPLGSSVSDIPTLISTVLGYVVKIGGVVAIFAFIYSGYKFVAARGNETELIKAKAIFFNTCIGVAVLLGAQLIASIIVGTIKNLQS